MRLRITSLSILNFEDFQSLSEPQNPVKSSYAPQKHVQNHHMTLRILRGHRPINPTHVYFYGIEILRSYDTKGLKGDVVLNLHTTMGPHSQLQMLHLP